jgi:hypothetical protein
VILAVKKAYCFYNSSTIVDGLQPAVLVMDTMVFIGNFIFPNQNVTLQKSFLLLIFRPYNFASFGPVLSTNCSRGLGVTGLFRFFYDQNLAKKLGKKNFLPKGNKNSSTSSLGRPHTQQKISGYGQKNFQVASIFFLIMYFSYLKRTPFTPVRASRTRWGWQASFLFFNEKACQKQFLSDVFANWRIPTKKQATHTQ